MIGLAEIGGVLALVGTLAVGVWRWLAGVRRDQRRGTPAEHPEHRWRVGMVRVAGLVLAGVVAVAVPSLGDELRVIDGDTFAVRVADGQDRRVRLWGIDAPERGEPGADAATMALDEILAGDLQCRQVATDRYGRVVAQCWADGRDVAMELVCRGLVEDWPRYSGGAYAECRG